MDFSNLVLSKLKPVLEENDLKVIERREGYIKLQSPRVEITIVYNKRENSHYFFAGPDEKRLSEIGKDVIEQVFGSRVKLRFSPTEAFLEDLLAFFQENGQLIVKGDARKLLEMEQYCHKRDKENYNGLARKYLLADADAAWEKKDYRAFINILDKTNINDLPRTYELKYRIASKKAIGQNDEH